MRKTAFIVLLFAAITLFGCASLSDDIEIIFLTQGEFKPGDAIPGPTGPIVLKISRPGVENLSLDMTTLENMGLVEYTVNDPWLLEDVKYSGVLISEILRIIEVGDYSEINVIALDGYAAPVPKSEIDAWPVLLATRSNGSYMDVENSGPTRIIFPFDEHNDLADARNMSVWNIETLEIR